MRERKEPKARVAKNPTARSARRVVIAKAVASGTPTSVIAKQVGISRQFVNLEIRAPETQQLIRSWMQPHHAAIKRMIPRALAAIHTGLKPSQKMTDRLAAVKTLGTVLEWSEGRATDGDSDTRDLKFSGTMEQLLAVFYETTRGELPAPTQEAQ